MPDVILSVREDFSYAAIQEIFQATRENCVMESIDDCTVSACGG
jgi:hypothetical protein